MASPPSVLLHSYSNFISSSIVCSGNCNYVLCSIDGQFFSLFRNTTHLAGLHFFPACLLPRSASGVASFSSLQRSTFCPNVYFCCLHHQTGSLPNYLLILSYGPARVLQLPLDGQPTTSLFCTGNTNSRIRSQSHLSSNSYAANLQISYSQPQRVD